MSDLPFVLENIFMVIRSRKRQ